MFLFTNDVLERWISCSSTLGTVTLWTATRPFLTRQSPLEITCSTCCNISRLRILPTRCVLYHSDKHQSHVAIRLVHSEWER